MANIKSQIKRNITNLKAFHRNRSIKSKLHTLNKKVRNYCKENNYQNANEVLSEAFKTYDKAVAKNIIKKNNAADKKSKLQKLVNSIKK